MRFEDIYWHDGQILGWTVTSSTDQSDTGAVVITAAVYESLQSPERFEIEIVFENVKNLSVACNFAELAEHFSFGNIDWATKEGARNYRFDLFGDNSFELSSGKVSIRQKK